MKAYFKILVCPSILWIFLVGVLSAQPERLPKKIIAEREKMFTIKPRFIDKDTISSETFRTIYPRGKEHLLANLFWGADLLVCPHSDPSSAVSAFLLPSFIIDSFFHNPISFDVKDGHVCTVLCAPSPLDRPHDASIFGSRAVCAVVRPLRDLSAERVCILSSTDRREFAGTIRFNSLKTALFFTERDSRIHQSMFYDQIFGNDQELVQIFLHREELSVDRYISRPAREGEKSILGIFTKLTKVSRYPVPFSGPFYALLKKGDLYLYTASGDLYELKPDKAEKVGSVILVGDDGPTTPSVVLVDKDRDDFTFCYPATAPHAVLPAGRTVMSGKIVETPISESARASVSRLLSALEQSAASEGGLTVLPDK